MQFKVGDLVTFRTESKVIRFPEIGDVYIKKIPFSKTFHIIEVKNVFDGEVFFHKTEIRPGKKNETSRYPYNRLSLFGFIGDIQSKYIELKYWRV